VAVGAKINFNSPYYSRLFLKLATSIIAFSDTILTLVFSLCISVALILGFYDLGRYLLAGSASPSNGFGFWIFADALKKYQWMLAMLERGRDSCLYFLFTAIP
jgi:hypothetical protein